MFLGSPQPITISFVGVGRDERWDGGRVLESCEMYCWQLPQKKWRMKAMITRGWSGDLIRVLKGMELLFLSVTLVVFSASRSEALGRGSPCGFPCDVGAVEVASFADTCSFVSAIVRDWYVVCSECVICNKAGLVMRSKQWT